VENLKGGFAGAFVLVEVAPRSEGNERLAQYTFMAPIDRVSAATAGRSRGRLKMVTNKCRQRLFMHEISSLLNVLGVLRAVVAPATGLGRSRDGRLLGGARDPIATGIAVSVETA
jgi:hypothetical protein